jgi:hypothetical protein
MRSKQAEGDKMPEACLASPEACFARISACFAGVFAPRFATFGMQFGDKKPEACFASCMLASHASKEAMKQALLFFATYLGSA